jgi:trk system potassium uptake protein TrkH
VKTSVQIKTVLMTTGILILSGMVILLWSESSITMKDFSFKERLLAALFQSVTARTAGFNTLDIGAMGNASLSFIIFLMFIGASPGSCGGGIKTTTLAILGAFSWARVRGKISVNMFNKTIPRETVSRSVFLLVLSIGFISIIFFLLLLSQEGQITNEVNKALFPQYLFEVVSAFGTVGLSMGATANLTGWGKLLIVVMMLIGRVGVLTFSYLIASPEGKNGIEHAEENLMIG